ncbi:Uncharacterised protein [Neisseria meningitidis]|nr:Uncharacterised protein [Neisseria meningitidis]
MQHTPGRLTEAAFQFAFRPIAPTETHLIKTLPQLLPQSRNLHSQRMNRLSRAGNLQIKTAAAFAQTAVQTHRNHKSTECSKSFSTACNISGSKSGYRQTLCTRSDHH